jgi:hypothetical protein
MVVAYLKLLPYLVSGETEENSLKEPALKYVLELGA